MNEKKLMNRAADNEIKAMEKRLASLSEENEILNLYEMCLDLFYFQRLWH